MKNIFRPIFSVKGTTKTGKAHIRAYFTQGAAIRNASKMKRSGGRNIEVNKETPHLRRGGGRVSLRYKVERINTRRTLSRR